MSSPWSWIPEVPGVGRGGKRVYVLQGRSAIAQLTVPLPFRGNDLEHAETDLRWTPIVLAGYPALGLSGAEDPLDASVVAWLTPFGHRQWELMTGAGLPDLRLAEGTLLYLPDVPPTALCWPRSAG